MRQYRISWYASNFRGMVLRDHWAVSDDQGLVGKPTSYIICFFFRKNIFFCDGKKSKWKIGFGRKSQNPIRSTPPVVMLDRSRPNRHSSRKPSLLGVVSRSISHNDLGRLWGGDGGDITHPNTPEINDLGSYLDPCEIWVQTNTRS